MVEQLEAALGPARFGAVPSDLMLRSVRSLQHASWFKMASTLSDDTAPSASLDHLEAQAAPTHPRAPPEPLGSLPWPQELASGRPKVEDLPLSTTRRSHSSPMTFEEATAPRPYVVVACAYPGTALELRGVPREAAQVEQLVESGLHPV